MVIDGFIIFLEVFWQEIANYFQDKGNKRFSLMFQLSMLNFQLSLHPRSLSKMEILSAIPSILTWISKVSLSLIVLRLEADLHPLSIGTLEMKGWMLPSQPLKKKLMRMEWFCIGVNWNTMPIKHIMPKTWGAKLFIWGTLLNKLLIQKILFK